MAATYDEIMAKSRELFAAGDVDGAKRLAQIALSRKTPAEAVQKNPDGTYGQPPEGFVLNPATGQMEDLRSPNNPNIPASDALGAFSSGAGSGLSYGGADEGVGAILSAGNSSYEYERDRLREWQRRSQEAHPVASLSGEILGAIASPISKAGALANGGSLAARIGKSAAVSGALGGLYGFGSAEGGATDRLGAAGKDAGFGAIVGAALPIAGAAVNKVGDKITAARVVREAARNAPTTDEVRAASRAAYKAVDGAGVSVRPDVVQAIMGDIGNDIRSEGLKYRSVGSQMPASNAVLGVADEVASTSQNTVPMGDLDVIRRAISASSASNLANQNDTRVATQALTKLDDFVAGLGAADIDAGDIATVQEMLPKARELWAKASRSQMIEDAVSAGKESYLSGGASGIKNQFKRIYNNPKLSRAFSDAELKLMSRVINGSIPEQVLGSIGSGLGQIATVTSGFFGGGVPGALGGALASAGARKAAEVAASRRAEVVRAIMANGGLKSIPKYSGEAGGVIEALLRKASPAVLAQ